MRARAAWTALFWLAIAVFVEAIEWPMHAIGKAAFFVDRVTSDLDFKAKLSSVSLRFGENIIIVDPSPDVSMGFADTYFLQCFDIQIEHSTVYCSIRPYHYLGCIVGIRKIKVWWNIAGIDPNPRTNLVYGSFGRCFPTIPPHRMECPFYYKLCYLICGPDRMNSFTINECPFGRNEGFSTERNLISGGVGGALGDGDRRLHIVGLIRPDSFHCFDRLPEPEGLSAKYESLKQQYQRRDSTDSERSSIIPSLIVSFSCIILGFLLALFGCERFDDKWKLQSTALIGGGWFLVFSGIYLFLREILRGMPADIF